MKPSKLLAHIGGTLLAVFLLAALPILLSFDIFGAETADAVSSASLELPDQPSGDFVILMRADLHRDTAADWESFFKDEDFAVIFEDISCLVSIGDESAKQLAERYMAQLPENQMTLRSEDATLLASKAEAGYIDVAIFSREMADAIGLSPRGEKIRLIELKGGAAQ